MPIKSDRMTFKSAMQPANKAAREELLGKVFPVLKDGFVVLMDVMGDDYAITEAARGTSGAVAKSEAEERGLIRYLLRHAHTTPIEMCELKFLYQCPLDCQRQWIRTRTACLSGDTRLHFDLPGGLIRGGWQRSNLTIKEVYDRFQPTQNATRPDKQRNPYFKRERIQQKLLRCVNEATGEVTHTRINDIWETGIKHVWEVSYNGHIIKASRDHLFFTSLGWKKLYEIVDLVFDGTCRVLDNVQFRWIGACGNRAPIVFNEIDTDTESWLPIVGEWQDYYEVSDQGRVRRIVGGRGSRSYGRCKKLTVTDDGHAVVSLNRPGVQVTRLVHQLVMEAFVGPCPDGLEVCHDDGNGLNNDLDNLRYDTPASNGEDRIRDGATTRLTANLVVPQIRYAGEEQTYDLEVVGPWHNFAADGFVVHNSVNEYSTRYREAIDAADYTDPGEWRLQNTGNRQGSSNEFVAKWAEGHEWRPRADLQPISGVQLGDVYRTDPTTGQLVISAYAIPNDPGQYLSTREDSILRSTRDVYEERLQFGVAKEQARKDLPLSTYTEVVWKIDLHNLLHFLSLRMDAHAQLEIRTYANIIGNEIVAKLFPYTWEAFNDFHMRRGGLLLSRLDSAVISSLANNSVMRPPYLSAEIAIAWETVTGELVAKRSRERDECIAKLTRMGLCRAA